MDSTWTRSDNPAIASAVKAPGPAACRLTDYELGGATRLSWFASSLPDDGRRYTCRRSCTSGICCNEGLGGGAFQVPGSASGSVECSRLRSRRQPSCQMARNRDSRKKRSTSGERKNSQRTATAS